MLPRFDYGDAVRVVRNIRNDGTFPGAVTGELLIRGGSIGFVRQIGIFLQEQIIYSVHFLNPDDRVVGCRETELISADAPWVVSQFECRDRVKTRFALAVAGKIAIAAGSAGEVIKVIRDAPGGVLYHVHFPGRTLQVPEGVLEVARCESV
jgi:nitrogen fixation protein NifZ